VPRGGRPSPRRKSIYDPVHGPIALQDAPLDLIGHRAFQRLWGIRQTGLAHLVFPGANHTRLEHSLGVYWVAARMAQALGLGDRALRTVECGGLLHDLGHAPFSHTLDGSLREVLGVDHESLSRRWIVGGGPDAAGSAPEEGPTIPDVLERHGLDPREVADLVDPPSRPRGAPLGRSLLHGPIDADRLDYLQRDAHYTGVAHGVIDAARLLDTVESDRGRLVFAEKGRSAVEGFLVGRALMYNAVYYHKTVRAAEVMLAGAVERVPEYPESARGFFGLTDGDLLAELDRRGGRSRELARGVRSRQLYKRVGGYRALPPARRRSVARTLGTPAARRQLEDELASLWGAPPGTLLLDLAGLTARAPGEELREIAVRAEGRVVRPFWTDPHWRSLLLRPPSAWALSVYVHPAWRRAAEERLPRALPRFL
jgi:HD superfamily phosphohydrolase